MKMKKAYAVIAAIVVIGGGYYWYSKANSKTTQTQYVTSIAGKGTITASIAGSGNIIVDQSSNVDPTITGTVTNLAVVVGDQVKKGQLLFTIDNNDLSVSVAKSQSSIASSESSLKSAKSSLKQAQLDYDTIKDENVALDKKNAAKSKLDAAKASVVSAEKSLSATKADAANQQLDANKRRVTSPIDGTVNEVNIKNGDDLSKLSSGSSRSVPIIIGDLGTMKAQVAVNEVDISNVSIGQKVTMTFSAIDGLTATGKVENMDSLGTLSSGVVTYNVTIGFDDLDSRIKPQMSVSANIITDVKQDAVMVPSGAIKTQNGNSYVEVLNSGAVPSRASVKTGISNDTDTEIVSGLNAGDKVVTQTISGTSTTVSGSSSSASTKSSESSLHIPGLGGGGGRPD
ncbi:MAG: efflux RND transporter periplasmic adaptor subunit [Candidatus Moranbacteria bacterium]|nr:efflux RND transporter periplasmic adaptor subunit [Candidatus Moranbacteria bacterium]